MQGIYKIINRVNGKYYVGSAIDFDARWWTHRDALLKGDHSNIYLQSAWNKYGEEGFSFEISEEVNGDRAQLLEVEQKYLDKGFEAEEVYNLSPYAAGGCGQRSEKTKQKISSTMKGMGLVPWNKGMRVDLVPADVRRRIGIVNRENSKGNESHAKPYPAFYNVFTEETIPAGANLSKLCRECNLNGANMGNVRKGVVLETRDGWRLLSSIGVVRTKPPGMKGQKHTEETKQLLREKALEWHGTHESRNKGKKLSEEHRRNVSIGLYKYYETHEGYMKGKKQTAKSNEKRRQVLLGREVSEETRAKLREVGAKVYPAFFNDRTYKFIPAGRNLGQMCTEYQFSYGVMYAIKRGLSCQTRDGWQLATPKEIEEHGTS